MISKICTPKFPLLKSLFVVSFFVLSIFAKGQASTVNYSFSTNTTGSLDAMTGSITLVGSGSDDVVSSITNITFPFTFMGATYTQFSANSNGHLRLGTAAAPTGIPRDLSNTNGPIIAAFTRDLFTNTASSGKVHYKVTGTSPNRILVVEWLNMELDLSSSTGDGTYQVWLYENDSRIKFVYGTMAIGAGATGTGFGIGFNNSSVASGSIGCVTSSTHTYSTTGHVTNTYTVGSPITELTSSMDGSRRVYEFIPTAANAAPTSLSFTGVGVTGMTLNWTDNATDELGYAVARSTDGANFTGVTLLAANSTSSTLAGLTANTTYYFRVYAIKEGNTSFLAGSQITNAGTISGIKTVGTGGDYSNLTAAFSDINTNGLAGNVELQLTTGYPAAAETYPITTSKPNTTGAFSIKIYPTVTGLSITSSNATATFSFDSCQNITIDGRVNQTGSTIDLQVVNTSTTGSAIQFTQDASSNIVNYLMVKAASTSTTAGAITLTSAVIATGCDNNTIQNSEITANVAANGVTNGIYINGVNTFGNTGQHSGNQILNNKIYDFYNSTSTSNGGVGVNLVTGHNTNTISGNSFYQTFSRVTFGAGATFNGILSSGTSSFGNIITNNFIGGTSANCGGTPLTISSTATVIFRGIQLTTGTTTATSVQGNTIQNISVTTASTSTAQGLLALVSGRFDCGTVTGNTLGSQAVAGSVQFTQSTTSTAAVFTAISAGTGSADTVKISNNTIGGITVSNSSTGTLQLRGITVQGGTGSFTVNNNTIGSPFVPNSLNNTTNNSIFGLLATASLTTFAHQITNNTVVNIRNSNSGTSTTTTATGMSVQGSTGGVFNVTGNTIYRISSAVGGTGTGSSASVVGLAYTASTTPGAVVAQNTIHTIFNTNTGSSSVHTTGLVYSGSTAAGNNLINRNFIHSIFQAANTGTTSTINGINFIGGSGTATDVTNNIIRLGIDSAGNAITDNRAINGINDGSAGARNYYHNTVYIGGSVSGGGSLFTFAFSSSTTTTARSFRNNIFVNVRSNTGAGGSIAIGLGGTWPNPSGLTLDNNAYFVTGSGTNIGRNVNTAVSYATLDLFRAAIGTAQDANSIVATNISDISFINATGTNTTVDLHITGSTIIESAGNAGATVATDFDGATRSGLTPVDIGADAGNFTIIDIVPPTISYTALGTTCGTSSRTLTASISDVSGVPTSGSGLPVLYWKINAGPYTAATGTYVSGNNYDFTFGAGVAANDVISYYIVAQDAVGTPNVTVSPLSGASGFSASPPAVSTPPTTPSSYTIGSALSGTYNVGSAQTYTTITNAVAAYNVGCLTGAVTFQLMDATYSGETVPLTINNHTDASITNTLTIKPASGVTSTITGSSSTGIFVLNGADYVTIDGSNNGSTSRDLTVINTNTGTGSAVVWIQTAGSGSGVSATNNTVKNCVITGNSNTTTLVGIGSGANTISTSSLGTSNNNNTIQNNNISKVQHGIYSQGASATTKNTGTTISNNLLNTASPNNIATTGIRVGFEDGVSIIGNDIDALQAPSTTDAVAIGLGSASVTTSTFTGNEVINASVLRNKIGTVRGASTYSAIGILYTTTTNTGTSTIANNMIHDVQANGTGGDIGAGIFIGAVVGTVNVFYNSVTLRSTLTSGTYPSFGFASASNTPTLNIRNNIFSSTGSTGANLNRAMGFAYSTFTNVTSNNNDLVFSGTTSAAVQTVNLTNSGATSHSTLADWNTASSKDLNSISVAPTFTSVTDLHLVNSDAINISNFYNKGAVVSVTTDFDGSTRGTINTDIGVDEFIPTTTTAWEGNTSTDWATATNWKQSSTPSSGTHIIIPGTAINQPVLSGATSIGNLTYTGSGSILSVNGNALTLNGTISGSGFVRGSSTSAISINGSGAFGTLNMDQTTDGTTNVLSNFTLNRTTSGTASLGNKTVVTGVLTLTDGTLTTGGFLHLRSNATSTARVAPVGATAAISGNTTVERYLQNKRAWRLLTAPLSNATSLPLSTTWQQQTHIVGITGTGFDIPTQTPLGYSMMTYNPTTQIWDSVKNTTTQELIGTSTSTGSRAFAAFITGNRSVDINNNTASSAVTLLPSARLLTGNQDINLGSLNANDYALVGNPYASPVDLDSIWKNAATTNINRTFYTWDPSLSGTGGYVTISWNSGTMSYDITPPASSQTQHVQSGQAFFVQATAAAATNVRVEENDKSTTTTNTVFGVGNGNIDKLHINLKRIDNGSLSTRDGVMVNFGAPFSKQILTTEDADKLFNNEEGITIRRNNKSLSIERRSFITNVNDTIFLGLNRLLPNTNYTLSLNAQGWDAGMQAYLVDKLLSTETPINLQSASQDISITSAVADVPNRWMVVFRGTGNLPNNKLSLVATKKDKDVQLTWNIASEIGVKEYELQRSVEGTNFQAINNQVAANKAEYNNTDTKANNGINYYRVKMTMVNDDVRYSNVVSINLKLQTSTPITIYPNPIKGSIAQLQLNDLEAGNYTIRLMDMTGKLVQSQIIQHQGGTASRSLSLGNIAVGTYQLVLEGKGIIKAVPIIKTSN